VLRGRAGDAETPGEEWFCTKTPNHTIIIGMLYILTPRQHIMNRARILGEVDRPHPPPSPLPLPPSASVARCTACRTLHGTLHGLSHGPRCAGASTPLSFPPLGAGAGPGEGGRNGGRAALPAHALPKPPLSNCVARVQACLRVNVCVCLYVYACLGDCATVLATVHLLECTQA